MATRSDIVAALASGAKFIQLYGGDATWCWLDLEVEIPSGEPLTYRVGPYPSPVQALDGFEAILTEAKRA
jgi:hypothetical protein